MKDRIKTLSLVLVAVFTTGAVGASAASAAEIHSLLVPSALGGNPTVTHVLTTTSGTVTCKTSTSKGKLEFNTATTVKMEPEYNNCTAFGFIGVPIHENGCYYLFSTNGTTRIECASHEIEITVPGCTYYIGPQHIASGNTFTNESGLHILVHTNLSGITYRECNKPLEHDGTYKGTTTWTSSQGSWFT